MTDTGSKSMDQWQVTLVTSTLTFIGTVLVAFLGYRQWKRSRSSDARSAFHKARLDAHRELFGLVEGAHVEIRTMLPSKQRTAELAQGINIFLMKNSLFLDASLQRIAASYFDSVAKYYERILEHGDDKMLEEFGQTVLMSPKEVEKIASLNELRNDINSYRDNIVETVRRVLNEDSP